MSPEVIRLTPNDAERFARLRGQMLTEAPWAYAATPEDDAVLDLVHLRKSLAEKENAIVAIETTDALVAAAGIFRMKSPKFSHRAKLWGVFVAPSHRRSGFGRAVTTAAVALASSWRGVEFIDLGVSANSLEALHLYETLQFRVWGREPEATEHNGRRYDELYMSLRIEDRGSV